MSNSRKFWAVLILVATLAFFLFPRGGEADDPPPETAKVVTSSDGSVSEVIIDDTAPTQAKPVANIDDHSVSPGTIVVDGDPTDWFNAGIAELITDPSGDWAPPGLDTLSLRVTDDGVNVYFLYEFAGPPVDSSYLFLDADTDIATGCSSSVGIEYGVTFSPSDIQNSYIGDARDCGWGDDFSGALNAAVGGNFIEASVSIDTLKILNPAITQFDITCANDNCNVGRYVLGNQTVLWEGLTSDGLPMNFTVVQSDTGPIIPDWSFNFLMTCEISGASFTSGVGFGGFDVPVVNEQFSFEYQTLSTFFDWSGGFVSPTRAKGRATYIFPALTLGLRAERCLDRRVSWQAQPVTSLSSLASNQEPDRVIEVRKGENGEVQVNILR